MPENWIVSYDDDTVIFSSDINSEKTDEKMNKYSHDINIWIALTELSLNVSITVFICVTCVYCAQHDEADWVASSNMRAIRRKTCTGIGSSVVRALVAKTKGSGFKSPLSHAMPFF